MTLKLMEINLHFRDNFLACYELISSACINTLHHEDDSEGLLISKDLKRTFISGEMCLPKKMKFIALQPFPFSASD